MKITTLRNKSPFKYYPAVLKLVDSNLRVERTRDITMCIEKRFVPPSVNTDHFPNIIGRRYTRWMGIDVHEWKYEQVIRVISPV